MIGFQPLHLRLGLVSQRSALRAVLSRAFNLLGSFETSLRYSGICRAAYRLHKHGPAFRYYDLGFRVVRVR